MQCVKSYSGRSLSMGYLWGHSALVGTCELNSLQAPAPTPGSRNSAWESDVDSATESPWGVSPAAWDWVKH